ncbi:MAG: Hsp20/alpha crystallin family protein [Candidatus Aenigmarchaeota archaeon]|nr:Hsp20/alpha crystallin family protein [Candidatus Aenigmarchaeota archaeon]
MNWEPFEEIERMRRRMERLMRTFWYGMPIAEELEKGFPVDMAESEDELILRADLPGFSRDEIAVRASDDSVEIAAMHKEKKVEREERMFRMERRVGAARRFLTLPTEVDVESAKTSFENGVLEIRFKKKKPAKKLKEIKLE